MNEFVKTGEVRVVKNQNKWEIRCNYTKSSKSSSSKRKTAYGYSSQLAFSDLLLKLMERRIGNPSTIEIAVI